MCDTKRVMRGGRRFGVWLALAGCTHAPAVQGPPTGDAAVRDEVAPAPREPDVDPEQGVVSGDECPDGGEIYNGIADADGCPDEIPPDLAAVLGVIPGITFKSGKWDLLPSSFPVLDRIAEVLMKYAEVRVFVDAHKDAKGSDKYGRRETQKQADSIKKYLVHRGVEAHRIEPRGMEENVPIADNKTADGRAMNRRVELKLRTR